VLDALLTRIRDLGPSSIAIEGAPNSGKTTLGRHLVERLPATLFSLDTYVRHRGEVPYRELIDAACLTFDLAACLDSNRIPILEGVCLREVLDLIDFQPQYFVYVRNRSNEPEFVGVDLSKDQFHEFELTHREEMASLVAVLSQAPAITLDFENAQYHFVRKPVSHADFVFEWGGA
jgi:hypothetical protein